MRKEYCIGEFIRIIQNKKAEKENYLKETEEVKYACGSIYCSPKYRYFGKQPRIPVGNTFTIYAIKKMSVIIRANCPPICRSRERLESFFFVSAIS